MSNEDKYFFSFTGIIGFFSEFETIINAQIVNENIYFILFQAGSVAFISGFLGLVGKKLAEIFFLKFRKK